MADEREDATPTGAALEDETTTTQELKAALSRARVDDLAPAATVAAATASAQSSSSTLPATPAGPAAQTPVDAAPAAATPTETGSGEAEDSFASAVTPRPEVIEVPINHPMAALYMNTPEPPEFKGNRGIGILIALLAGVTYAALFAGIIALLLAPALSPSQFSVIFVEYLLSLAFVIPVAAFVVSLMLLVVVSNRAGWWAYVLGGFLVGVVVWVAATGGLALSPDISELTRLEGLNSLFVLALLPMPLLAGVAAREMTVWFGAWIGARGRKIAARNAEALDEYEEALAASQNSSVAPASQPNVSTTISE